MKVVGIVSDTHGLLRPKALDELKETDIIIHAGDVGSIDVLNNFKRISKFYAVKGNCDRGELAKILPETQMFEFENKIFYVIHDLKTMNIDPKAADISFVISGHTHKSSLIKKENVYYFNPGSIGPRRFDLPITLGKIYIDNNEIDIKTFKI